MKNNKWMIRISLFILIQLIVIFLSIVLRNIVLLLANNWFDEETSRYWVSSSISILAFVAIQFYIYKVVKIQKNDRMNLKLPLFSLRELAPFALYLLPCLFVTILTEKIDMFESLVGRIYAPYLAFDLWNYSPILSYILYILLEYLIIFILSYLQNRKDRLNSLSN